MTSITIKLKENVMLNCYLQTLIAYEIETEDIYENFFYSSNTKEIGKLKMSLREK